MKPLALAPIALALAACATTAPPIRSPGRVPVTYASLGLQRVLGQDAAGLVRLFGAPEADVREGSARKLQFSGATCVLDAYLYPKSGAEPRVTYLDARTPDGSPIDRASCAAALARREGGQ